MAFAIEGTNYVQVFNTATLAPRTFFIPNGPPKGIAYGVGDLYLTYGTTIERDTLTGTVLASHTQGAGLNLTSIAVAPNAVFAIEGGNYIQSFNITTLSPITFFIPSAAPQGLAYGNGSLFVTHGTTIERDSLNGSVLASHTQAAGLNLTSIAVAPSVVFAIEGTSYIQAFDALTLVPLYYFIPAGAPQGIGYADGNLYVTYGTTIERDTLDGDVLASHTQGAGLNLAGIAIEPNPVPEPASFGSLAIGLLGLAFLKLRSR